MGSRNPVRHIYVGASMNKVWCGERLGNRREVREAIGFGRITAPLTEGEYRDESFGDVCEECAAALTSVRPT